MTDTQTYDAPVGILPAQGSPPSEVSDVLRRIRRSWWIVILCAIVAVAAGVGLSSRVSASYHAETYVLLNTSNYQQAVAGGYNPVDPQTALATAVALLTPVREARAAQAAGLAPTANFGLSVNAASNSSVLVVDASTADARTAAALADAAAQQMISAVQQANATALGAARATVVRQLRNAARRNRQPLAAELNTFSTLQALSDRSLQVIQPALIPAAATRPSRIRIGGIALVLGLVLGLGIALLRRPRHKRE